MDNTGAGTILRVTESTRATPEAAAPQGPQRILPPLLAVQTFRTVMQAFRDMESGVVDSRSGISAVVAKAPPGSSQHVSPTGVAIVYSIASNIIGRLRAPDFATNVQSRIYELVTDMESLFPEWKLRDIIARELLWSERETLVYSIFFLHLDRTYFVHKWVRVPEPILAYLRTDETKTHGVRFLKESLAHLSMNQDRQFTRHLELGFCLLSGDDSFEIAELVEEATRTSDQGIAGTPNKDALERLEREMRACVESLQENFNEIEARYRMGGRNLTSEISHFLLRTDAVVDRFGVVSNLMNWCMAPYAEEPAHRPFISLLRARIGAMDDSMDRIRKIVQGISEHYPANSPVSTTRNGTLVSILDMRIHLVRYTLCKIRLNTAPILLEQSIRKKSGQTAANTELYHRHVAAFEQSVAEAYEHLDSIIETCRTLSSRSEGTVDRRDDPTVTATTGRVDQVIGQTMAFLDRESSYALREKGNIRKYQELCNLPYLHMIFAAYEQQAGKDRAVSVELGMERVLSMQEASPETLVGVEREAPVRVRRLQFIERFALNPPEDPDTFRTTAENVYQLFRTLKPAEISDGLIIRLVELLTWRVGWDTDERQSRRTSIQVSFLLLETTRAIRRRIHSRGSWAGLSGAIDRLSELPGNIKEVRTSPDTLGRVCLELGRIHATLSLREGPRRRRDADEGPTRQERLLECLGHAYYLHPNIEAALDDMEVSERRAILAAIRQRDVGGIEAAGLTNEIRRDILLAGSRERQESTGQIFSDEIRTTVQELLDNEDRTKRPQDLALRNLESRMCEAVLPALSKSALHGLGTIHFELLGSGDTPILDSNEALLAGVRAKGVKRGRHITPLATYGSVVAFIEHDPLATARIKQIMLSEWLEREMSRFCEAVVDLQDGLDTGALADKCLDSIEKPNSSGIANAFTAWVLDPEGFAYAANAGNNKPKNSSAWADSRQKDTESCYLQVRGSGPSYRFEWMNGTQTYAREVTLQTSTHELPGYLRPGSTIMLSPADHVEYLRHLVDIGILTRENARRMHLKEVAKLADSTPLVGMIMQTKCNGEIIVNVTGPLTLAHCHLATERAKKRAGAPFLSAEAIERANSMDELFVVQSSLGPIAHSTIPSVRFHQDRESMEPIRRALSFLGHNSFRIVFEISWKDATRLGTVLSEGRNMARPLRIIASFRKNLSTSVMMECQKRGVVSGEEVFRILEMVEAAEKTREKQLIEETSKNQTETNNRMTEISRWFQLIDQVAKITIKPEGTYDADSLDADMEDGFEQVISQLTGYQAISQAIMEIKWIGQAIGSPAGCTIRLGQNWFSPVRPSFDQLALPRVTTAGSSGLVELTFRYVPDAASDAFLKKMRDAILEKWWGAKQKAL